MDIESGEAIINFHCCQAVSLLGLYLEELFYFLFITKLLMDFLYHGY